MLFLQEQIKGIIITDQNLNVCPQSSQLEFLMITCWTRMFVEDFEVRGTVDLTASSLYSKQEGCPEETKITKRSSFPLKPDAAAQAQVLLKVYAGDRGITPSFAAVLGATAHTPTPCARLGKRCDARAATRFTQIPAQKLLGVALRPMGHGGKEPRT